MRRSASYRHFRVLFPEAQLAPFGRTAVAEVQLLGLPADSSLRITEIKVFSPELFGQRPVRLTWLSIPGTTYEIQQDETLGGMGVQGILTMQAAADGFITTYQLLDLPRPKNFFQVEEAPTPP